MRIKILVCSLIILILYCIVIVMLPYFDSYIWFRGCVLPATVSIILTIVNFNILKNIRDYITKLFVFIVLGYALRALVFFILNGYFDVDFRYLKNDWYSLYIIMQVPVLIVASALTYIIVRIILWKKYTKNQENG